MGMGDVGNLGKAWGAPTLVQDGIAKWVDGVQSFV